MKHFHLFLCLALCSFFLSAQDYIPKNDGVNVPDEIYTVFTNATIHTSPEKTITNGTLVIQKGKIVSVGTTTPSLKNSLVHDLKGKHIYPSFIDVYTTFGIDKPKKKIARSRSGSPVYDATRQGYYWNDHIRTETSALDHFTFDNAKAKALLKLGFGVVQSYMPDGIARGTGILVALDTLSTTNERLISEESAQFFSFTKSSKSEQVYPTSLMGAMALLRQMYYDLDWYSKGKIASKDLSLTALQKTKNLPGIFEANSRKNSLRADKIGDEFGLQYTLVGGGDEFERINQVKATNATYILPVNFPKPYDVTDPYAADLVSLHDLRKWNQAPSNLAAFATHSIPFALTTYKLKDKMDFGKNLEKAIKYGLDKKAALAALTTIPAKILGKEGLIGSLQKNAYANFLVTDAPLFEPKTVIYENWVMGNKVVLEDRTISDISGTYTLAFAKAKYDITISGTVKAPKILVVNEKDSLKGKLTYHNKELTILIQDKDSTNARFTRFIASNIDDTESIEGKAVLPDGTETNFIATKTGNTVTTKKEKAKKDTEKPTMMPLTYPNKAYGAVTPPTQRKYLFKNATVWTNEKEGIMNNTDVLVTNGKIAKIGTNLSNSGAEVIDATGKHLTSGIIDEHSHIATDAINEAGQNSSAEVTIEDVIDPDDSNIYRNLAGGVTSIQILHGSANPIGGRSALIKLKWGLTADEMRYADAPKFIKFALGENVKQSNWGDKEKIRFPQSRMGVEQVYVDYFTQAKRYDELKKSGEPYRKDPELEALAEILNQERFISCHSYIQSEIIMLMRVAEKFNFKVNTFTHILEGYKVADKMKVHGAGGSTFSDWWAYKYEVRDAIPYNAAIMHRQGIVTAINSDDPEMSRRLNQEAAKSVKYGGVAEEEAWKFVTLNPAKLLHLDDRTGSIKIGKDADLVLWNDHPLSIYTKAEKTMIDGAIYFDLEKDAQQQKAIAKERNQLINMLLKEKAGGSKTQDATSKPKQHFHCETVAHN